jgi:hypothetical protein
LRCELLVEDHHATTSDENTRPTSRRASLCGIISRQSVLAQTE